MNAPFNAWIDSQHKTMHPLISVVVPLYNEAAVLPLFTHRLQQVFSLCQYLYEIVFVDDGSTDESLSVLQQFQQQGLPIRTVVLSRNFGKEAALRAGLEYCEGAAIIVLDADLQDPPELIPSMIKKWESGAEVVTMKRQSRQGDSWVKKSSAYLYYRLLSKLSNIPIPVDTGDFRLMSRTVVDAFLSLSERNRYNKGLFAWMGFKTVTIEYNRAARPIGQSKWSYWRLFLLALDGVTSFSSAPLRFILIFGIFLSMLFSGLLSYLLLSHTFLNTSLSSLSILITILGIYSGLQLAAIGLVGDYVGKTYFEAKHRPLFIVQTVLPAPKSSSRLKALRTNQDAPF